MVQGRVHFAAAYSCFFIFLLRVNKWEEAGVYSLRGSVYLWAHAHIEVWPDSPNQCIDISREDTSHSTPQGSNNHYCKGATSQIAA